MIDFKEFFTLKLYDKKINHKPPETHKLKLKSEIGQYYFFYFVGNLISSPNTCLQAAVFWPVLLPT